MNTPPYLLMLVLSLFIISCSNESIEEAVSEEIEEQIEEETEEEEEEEEEEIVNSDTPCTFTLEGLEPNSTIKINCIMDLNKSTVTLPANTILEFDGGQIINGTLAFQDSGAGFIDGRLMNSDLILSGDVKLIGAPTATFIFTPAKWKNIVQGQTISDIALSNTKNFENIMLCTRNMGATIFEVDKFDAYFQTTLVTSTTTNQNFYASREAVNVPSDFHLKMSNKTYLRQYPAEDDIENGTILAIREASNVKITGGNLVGDRRVRRYTPDDVGLQGTHLCHIHASKNVTIDGINFIEGSKGGLVIYALGFSFNPDYNPSKNVKVLNCSFENIRRMGIALTDGRDVTIQGNTFLNVGQPMNNSDGGEVGYAINVEAYRTRDSNGNLQENEIARDILITNNTEKNSRVGFVSVHIGQNVTIENNDISTRVVYSLTNGTKVLRNKFNAFSNNEDFAIFAAGKGETVFNNEIAYNEINGYGLGIATNTRDVEIHNNTITNCENGLQITKTTNAIFRNNTVDVNNNGISATSTFANNVSFTDNTITARGFHVKFSLLNKGNDDLNNRVNLDGNVFLNNRKVNFFKSNGINFTNNDVTGGIEIGDVTNIDISSNSKIDPSDSDGIRLFGTHSSVKILDNNILKPTGSTRFDCINNNSNTPNGIRISNNTCATR